MPRRPRAPAEVGAGAGPGSSFGLLPGELASTLAALPGLDTAALRAEWQRLHHGPPVPDLTRDLLLRGVAQRLQEIALGGLSVQAAKQLATMAAPQTSGARSAGAPVRAAKAGRLKPGTVLVRSWHGETHTVTVREQGFEHGGRLYRSLSTIAEEITGAHWSGPRFFGIARNGHSAQARRGRGEQGQAGHG